MGSPAQVRSIFHGLSGLARDDVVNTFNFSNADLSDGGSDVSGAVINFFALTNTHLKLTGYLSPDRGLGNAWEIEVYDLTGHLDGTPHGSPVGTVVNSLPDNTGHGPLPDLAAACLSYHASTVGIPESGPSGAIPTQDRAVDEGAPATHTGITRLKARRRGRVYLGTLNDLCLDWTGPGNRPVLHGNLLADMAQAATRLANAGFGWCVWSRRDAAMHNVDGGWIDNRFVAQRKREEDAGLRNLWSA